MKDYIIGVWVWIYTHAWWIALVVSALAFIVFGIVYSITNSTLLKVLIIVDFTILAVSISKVVDEQFPI